MFLKHLGNAAVNPSCGQSGQLLGGADVGCGSILHCSALAAALTPVAFN